MPTHSVTLHRVLSAEQAERRDQVIQSATELAEAGGYDAVIMKTVAERSGVALATLYRWFASKDHLLTEVLLAWGSDVSADLADAPLVDPDPVARVSGALRQIMVIAAARPQLASAIVAAVLTVEPAVFENQNDFHTMVVSWIDIALGDADLPNREEVVEVLELVCFSVIIGLVSGRDTAESAGDRLESATRLLFRTD